MGANTKTQRIDMGPLNYSRQLASNCLDSLEVPDIEPWKRRLFSAVVSLHEKSTKFMLPDGGRIFDDIELRSLDETVTLRLPFPKIALEYHSNGRIRNSDDPIGLVDGVYQYESDSFISAPKRIVYATEKDGFIIVNIAFCTKSDGVWRLLPECYIPTTNYLRRDINFNGRPGIACIMGDKKSIASDYMDEIGAVMAFLNVLQCSNVRIEKKPAKRDGKHVKSALQFDSYHVLTVDSKKIVGPSGGTSFNHRSPREHLRRGHIRRINDGIKVWVNATVVSSGKGFGIVAKDYAMRDSDNNLQDRDHKD